MVGLNTQLPNAESRRGAYRELRSRVVASLLSKRA